MFERFTEGARQVVVLAQDESRALRRRHIGTEHLLLGLFREEKGLAARVLEALDITIEAVRVQIGLISGLGETVTTGQLPFTRRAKKALELAAHESLTRGHNYVGTEHVLLGLVGVDESVAAQILLNLDVDADKVRNTVGASLERRSDGALHASLSRLPDSIEVIEAIREAKEMALDAQLFDIAARLRDLEHELKG